MGKYIWIILLVLSNCSPKDFDKLKDEYNVRFDAIENIALKNTLELQKQDMRISSNTLAISSNTQMILLLDEDIIDYIWTSSAIIQVR